MSSETPKPKVQRWRLKREDVLTLEDWRKVEAVLPQLTERNRILLLTLARTGLRREEASLLTGEDLHLDRKPPYLHVVHGKGERWRDVLLTTKTATIIARWVGLRRGPVFVSRKGGRLSGSQIERVVKQVARMAGAPTLHAHALRHLFATVTYQATKDLRFVQVQLGHTSITTTQVYLDLFMDVGEEHLDAFEQAMEPKEDTTHEALYVQPG